MYSLLTLSSETPVGEFRAAAEAGPPFPFDSPWVPVVALPAAVLMFPITPPAIATRRIRWFLESAINKLFDVSRASPWGKLSWADKAEFPSPEKPAVPGL